MAIEREPNHETSLFTPASPTAQKDAALSFLQSTKALLSSPEAFYYIASLENKINDPEVDGEIAIRAAIHGYDLLFSDEIRSYLPKRSPKTTDTAAVYYRSDVYRQTYPQIVLNAISSKVGSPITDVIVATRDHIDSFSLNSGHRGMLTPELSYWVGTEDNPITKPDPPCGIARQELYRSLLSCGVNPVEEPFATENEDNGDSLPDNRYRITFRRKGEVSLGASAEDLKRWSNNSSMHWRDILSEDQSKSHGSILFSSGTSSTEAVIVALSKRLTGETYIHPYWYYENISSAQQALQVSEQISSSTEIILLNLEPTNFFTFDESKEIESPMQALNTLAQICREDSEIDRYAVIDVTVDPLFQVHEHVDGELPKNLHIIKTLSASKHQRGGRKYFFGVAYTQDENLADEIMQTRPKVGGNIYDPHIVHFPRPSTTWLAKQRDTVKGINLQMADNLAQNNESGWVLRPHTYHTFFFPPPEVLERIQTLGTQNGNVETEVKHFNDAVSQIVADVVNEVDSPFVDLGDSFGLPFTRVCTQGGYNELNGVKFRLKLPRICPGYSTPPKLVEETSQKLLEALSVSYIQIMDTLK